MDPLTRLRRRPFLAPLLLPVLALVLVVAGVIWLGSWSRTTVIVLARHAEAGDATSGDPDLSAMGEKRAAMLGAVLSDLLVDRKVDYLYAADTRRAQQTAAPVANEFRLPINLLSSSDWSGLAARIRREHKGRTVVVVGYASTLPGVINQLSGGEVPIEDQEFDTLHVVVLPTPGETRVLRLRYGPASPAAEKAARPGSK